METSGVLRRRLQAAGHFAISADFLPAEDGSQFPEGERGGHIQDDVFAVLDYLRRRGLWPDAAIFHPDCTNLTNSAAWAYADPDFDRYPGIGYHQRVQPGTLTGGARRAAKRSQPSSELTSWISRKRSSRTRSAPCPSSFANRIRLCNRSCSATMPARRRASGYGDLIRCRCRRARNGRGRGLCNGRAGRCRATAIRRTLGRTG